MVKKNEQWLFENRVDTRGLIGVFEAGKQINTAVCVLSPPGCGKTEIVRQYADKHFNGNICEVILSHYSSVDLVGQGVPVRQDNGELKMSISKPTLVPLDPEWEGVIHLDEVTNISDVDMQHALYQLVHERKVGTYNLPSKAQVILSGNRVFDNGASGELLAPLANRMIIVEMEPRTEHWLEDYAAKQGCHEAIYMYVHDNPNKLYEYGSETDCPSFSTARSMKKASDACHSFESGKISKETLSFVIDGLLGCGKFIEVWPKYESAIELPRALDILKGNTKKKISKDTGLAGIYSVLSSCMFFLEKEIKTNKPQSVVFGKNFIKYLSENLEEEQEILVNFTNKLLKVGVDNNYPQFLREVRKDCQAFNNILVKYNTFRAWFEDLMKQTA